MWLRKPMQKAQAVCRHKYEKKGNQEGRWPSEGSPDLGLLPQISGVDVLAEMTGLATQLEASYAPSLRSKHWDHENSI